MTRRLTMLTLAISAACATLAACGPTAEGLKAREEARERLDLYGADFVYAQAMQEFESGQFEKAEKDAKRVISTRPEDVRAHVLLGRICLETNRMQEALDAFCDAVEARPEHAEAHYYRGLVLQRWARDAEAYEAYSAAYDLAQHELSYLTAAVESLIAIGRFEEARHEIEERIAYFEYNPTLIQLKGQIALLEADTEAAVNYFLDARVLAPDDTQLLEELAWAQYDAGHYGPCRESVRELKLRHGSAKRVDLDLLEARCLVMIGESRAAYDRYLELSHRADGNAAVWIEFGTLALEMNDYRRAGEAGRRAIGLVPTRYEGYLLKGVYEQHSGRHEVAIELFREAARRSSEDVLPMLMLGSALSRQGRDPEALAAYHEALQVDPGDADARRLYQATEDRIQLAAVGTEGAE